MNLLVRVPRRQAGNDSRHEGHPQCDQILSASFGPERCKKLIKTNGAWSFLHPIRKRFGGLGGWANGARQGVAFRSPRELVSDQT
jgi:hypothetical protein